MTTERATVTHEERRSWIPMIGLFLAQILMSFNVAARNSQRPWYQARRPRPLRIAQQHNVIRCHDLVCSIPLREGADGLFRAVPNRINGPVVITHPKIDKAVGLAYAIASRLAEQVAIDTGGPNDRYGGLGRNGALETPEALDPRFRHGHRLRRALCRGAGRTLRVRQPTETSHCSCREPSCRARSVATNPPNRPPAPRAAHPLP